MDICAKYISLFFRNHKCSFDSSHDLFTVLDRGAQHLALPHLLHLAPHQLRLFNERVFTNFLLLVIQLEYFQLSLGFIFFFFFFKIRSRKF